MILNLKIWLKKMIKKKVQDIVKSVSTWLENNPNAETEEYEAKKKEIEQVWTPIITAAYQGGSMSDMSGQGQQGGMPNYGNNEGSEPQIDEVD